MAKSSSIYKPKPRPFDHVDMAPGPRTPITEGFAPDLLTSWGAGIVACHKGIHHWSNTKDKFCTNCERTKEDIESMQPV